MSKLERDAGMFWTGWLIVFSVAGMLCILAGKGDNAIACALFAHLVRLIRNDDLLPPK